LCLMTCPRISPGIESLYLTIPFINARQLAGNREGLFRLRLA
jgi:hypothetical protein